MPELLIAYFLAFIFKFKDQLAKFRDFSELETPNKTIAQIMLLDWIKHAASFQKLNFDSDIVIYYEIILNNFFRKEF